MSAAQQKPMDIEQFLAWEERQELRHEFDGLRITAMTGGTRGHAAIQRNLILALAGRLRGKPCQPFGSELRIKMEHSVRYPDAFVVCTPDRSAATFVADPVVVFEILSKSTAREDYGPKAAEYQSIASQQRYVILQQSHRAAIVFARTDEGWDHELVIGAAAVLAMPEIGIGLPLAEIYEGLVLEGDGAAG